MDQKSSRSARPQDMTGWGTSRTRGDRLNHDQKMFLVSFMEAHREFAFGRYFGPRPKAQALWIQLTEEMNARGPKKTVAQWQKTWTDTKSRAKTKVGSKANNPNFDPVNDLDARVLSLLESTNENPNSTSAANSTDYGVLDSDMNGTDFQTDGSHIFHSLKVETPEAIFFPEVETSPPSVESAEPCSITDIKLGLASARHLSGGHMEDSRLGDAYLDLENQARTYDSEDIVENGDQNTDYSVIVDTTKSYEGSSAWNSKDTRQNHLHRNNLSNIRNRWKRPSHRSVFTRPNFSPPSSNLQRRQTETLEAISQALLQNAENEKERNRLMSHSLEINKARLKADIERNNLLRELLSTVRGLSEDQHLRLDKTRAP